MECKKFKIPTQEHIIQELPIIVGAQYVVPPAISIIYVKHLCIRIFKQDNFYLDGRALCKISLHFALDYLTFLTKKSACPQLVRDRLRISSLQTPG